MKQLVCDLCEGTNFVKTEGMFVCQNCGCKYTVDEAKRMMAENNTDVPNIIKVDRNDEEQNCINIGNNAVIGGNGELALLYANKALEINAKNADAWILKMRAIVELSTVGNSRLLELIAAGKAAIEAAGNNSTVEEKVYGCFLDQAINMIRFAHQKLLGGFNENSINISEDIAKNTLMIQELITEDALINHTSLCDKLEEFGIEYRNETNVLEKGFRENGTLAQRVIMLKEIEFRYNKINERILLARESKQKALEKYWNEHPKRKEELESQIKKATNQMTKLTALLNNSKEMLEKRSLDATISEMETDVKSLGILKIKEKKVKQQEIEELKKKREEIIYRISKNRKNYENQIARERSIIDIANQEISKAGSTI